MMKWDQQEPLSDLQRIDDINLFFSLDSLDLSPYLSPDDHLLLLMVSSGEKFAGCSTDLHQSALQVAHLSSTSECYEASRRKRHGICVICLLSWVP